MKEIVIKIPDEALSFVYQYGFVGKEHRNALSHAILQCTELPKGHGELIDRSKVMVNLIEYAKGNKTIGQCIDDASTIIEADKGEA